MEPIIGINMLDVDLQVLANKIVQEQNPLNHIQFYGTAAILIVLNLIGTYCISMFASYAQQKGKNYATKADFDNIVDQLKVTTESVETIKAEIAHHDWTTREWKTIRRIKLEELLTLVGEQISFMETQRSSRVFKKAEPADKDCIDKIKMLSRLYFPELDMAIYQVTSLARDYEIQILKHCSVVAGEQDLDKQMEMIKELHVTLQPIYSSLLLSKDTLFNAAAALMNNIMDVTQSPS